MAVIIHRDLLANISVGGSALRAIAVNATVTEAKGAAAAVTAASLSSATAAKRDNRYLGLQLDLRPIRIPSSTLHDVAGSPIALLGQQARYVVQTGNRIADCPL